MNENTNEEVMDINATPAGEVSRIINDMSIEEFGELLNILSGGFDNE